MLKAGCKKKLKFFDFILLFYQPFWGSLKFFEKLFKSPNKAAFYAAVSFFLGFGSSGAR